MFGVIRASIEKFIFHIKMGSNDVSNLNSIVNGVVKSENENISHPTVTKLGL